MEIVAHVFDWKITKTELDFEEENIRQQYPDADKAEIRNYAVNKLVDRYLLMHEAIKIGLDVSDEEMEDAMFEMIDDIDSPENSVLVNHHDRGEQLEIVIKSNILIKKYLYSLHGCGHKLTEEKLHQFYLERKDFFCRDEEVRASQILIKGRDNSSLDKIRQIRDSIHTKVDFDNVISNNTDIQIKINYGDLGFFPKGRMIPEIDQVAFTLKLNEISQPFLSKYGYHILMVTDRIEKQVIPFDEIKECLKESLLEIEEEVAVNRILTDIRERSKSAITIFDHAFE